MIQRTVLCNFTKDGPLYPSGRYLQDLTDVSHYTNKCILCITFLNNAYNKGIKSVNYLIII
jgi:hypothetical protein